MPELQQIEDWAAINDVANPVDKWTGFSNYVKAEYLKEDLNKEELREIYGLVDESMVNGAESEGVPFEQLQEALAPKAPTFEQKLSLIDRAYSGVRDAGDRKTLADYQAFQKVLAEQPDVPESFKQQEEPLRAAMEEVINNNYDEAVQWSLNNSDVPFARVELSDGTVQLQAGDAAIGLSASEAYEKSLAAGTVTPNDIPVIVGLVQKDKNGYEAFRHHNFGEAYGYLNKALQESDFMQSQLEVLTTEYADKGKIDPDRLDSLVTAIRSEDDNAKQLSRKDLTAALEYQIGFTAMMNGTASYDEDNLQNNIKSFGYGNSVYHRELLEDPAQFKEAIKGMSEADQQVAQTQREFIREALFPELSDSLSRSYLGDEWASYYADRKGSAPDPDLLNDFVENTKYSFLNKAQHLALAAGEGATDLIWSVGAIAGEENSEKFLIENMKDRQARATVARLFGQDFGMGTELAAVAAPIISDIIATAGVTAFTGGLGTAATLTAVGFKNTLKTGSKIIAREAVKVAGKSGAKKIVPSEFLATYANIVNKSAVKTSAVSSVAGLRSGGMLYASVFDSISRSPEGEKMSREEIRDRALGAAGTGFLVTAALVGAFGVGKFGGLESYVANGATTQQVKRVFERLAGIKLSDRTSQRALTKVLQKGHEQFVDSASKNILHSAGAEAVEEGIDGYLNTITEAAFTNSDLSFKDVATAAGMGALYGGILGGAMPAVAIGYQKTLGKADAVEAHIQSQIARQAAAEKLSETGSPKAASEFLREMATAELRPAQAPPAKKATPEDGATPEAEAEAVAEEARMQYDEDAAASAEVETLAPEVTPEIQAESEARGIEEETANQAVESLENATAEEIQEAVDQVAAEDTNIDPTTVEVTLANPNQGETITKEDIEEFQQQNGLADEEVSEQVEEAATETRSGKVANVEVEPQTQQGKNDKEVQANGVIERLLEIGYKVNIRAASGRLGFPKGIKKYLESRADDFEAQLDARRNDEKSKYFALDNLKKIHKAYPEYKLSDIEELKQGFKHRDDGYLFNNDPVAMASLLYKRKKAIKVPEGFNYNRDVFIVEDGVLVEVVNPFQSAKTDKADSGSVAELVSRRIQLNSAIQPADTKIKLNKVGFFLGEEDSIYILDGEVSFEEARERFRKWVDGNYAGLRYNRQYINALGISNQGLPAQELRDVIDNSVIEFVADVEHTLTVAAIDAEVGDLLVDGKASEDTAKELADKLVESGIFSQKAIEEVLDELSNLQFESGTRDTSDLKVAAITPKQKLAAFLYYTNTGVKGINNPFTKSPLRGAIDSTSSRKQLKDGWENRIIAISVENILSRTDFKRKEGGSYPNFMAIAGKVGTRMLKRRGRVSKLSQPTHIADVEISTDPVDTDAFGSYAFQAATVASNSLDDTTNQIIREIAIEQGSEIGVASFTDGFARLLQRTTEKRSKGEDVVSEVFYDRIADLPQSIKNLLVSFGFEPPISLEGISADYQKLQHVTVDLYRQYLAPNLVTFKQAKMAREVNNENITRLGLVDGDSESVVVALEEIAKTGVDESHRLVADLLLKNKALIRNTDFRIVDNPRSQVAGSFVKFEGERNRVSVNASAFYGSGIESVLLHEYLHAATFDLIRSGDLSTSQRAAIQRLDGLRQMVANNYRKSGRSKISIEQGISNIDEFIATSFTSATFQNEVRRLPESGLFRRILNAVKSLFGIQTNTRLAKAFDDLADFMNMDVSPATIDIDTVSRRAARSDTEATLLKYSEGIRKRVETAKNRRFASIEGVQYDKLLTPDQQAAMDELIDEVVAMTVPKDVPVIQIEEGQESPFEGREDAAFVTKIAMVGGKEVATIFINRKAAQTAMFGLVNEVTNDTHARMILESILNEEITHAAELRKITFEELDATAADLTLSEFNKIIEDYTEGAALRQTLKQGVRDGDVEILRQMVGEKLRMEVQKINRGYTTEQDKAFYISSPKFYQVMFRYLKGVFKRMYAKYNLNKNNPEMARMVNQMAYEIQLLRSGVFHIRDMMGFDISTPDLATEYLNRRFNATFENDKLKEITAETTDEEIYERFPFLQGFKLPVGVFKDGQYQSNQKIAKFLNGELDPRILELRRQADALQSSIDGRTERIMNEVMERVQLNPEATNGLLGDFLGRADDIEVPFEFRERRYKVASERLLREGSEKGRLLSDSERDMIVEEEVDKAIIAEETKLRNIAASNKEAAHTKLSQIDPELFDKLSELRLLLDALSKKFSSTFDTQGDLRATIDANLGIYIVRSYRAFLEEGYMDKVFKVVNGEAVAGDEQMVNHYQQVYKMFEEEYHKTFARKIQNKEREQEIPKEDQTSKKQLIEDSEVNLTSLKTRGRDPIRGAILEYLYSLDPNSRFKSKASPLATSVTKSMVDRIRSRKSVPEAFRKLLGQYDNSDVVENVLRSITMVSQAATKESFLRNIIELGRRPESKFAYSLKEVRLNQSQGIDLGLVNLRTGARADTVDIEEETLKDETEQEVSATKNYYVPKEMFSDLQKQFQRNVENSMASHTEFVEAGLRIAKYAVGASLAAKTLFSVGFYLRNYLGNVAFFAPLVGLNPIKAAAGLRNIGKLYKNNMEGLDDYTSELVMLNVAHGDLTSNTIKELLQGKTTTKELHQEAERLIDKVDKLLESGKNAYDKTVQPIMKRAVALSQAIDSAYKTVYFQNEFDVLKKAREEDQKKGVEEGQGYNLTDYDLKVRAAQAVRRTSQSYVDAYEAVKYATGKYSFLLPPFIRFRTDILRILFDGLPKQIKQELSSDNKVIRGRGVKRLAGATFTVGGISMIVPYLTKLLIAGLSDEEEDMLRETLPEWQKDATLFFLSEDSFLDLTYVNPLSGVTNMPYQAIGETMDGKPVTGLMKAARLLYTEYGGSQIVSSAIVDATKNVDPRTGGKIYKEDGSFGSFMDAVTYVYKQAYDPRAFAAIRNAASATLGDVPLDADKTALAIVQREFTPARPSTINWDQVFQRAVSNNKDRRIDAQRMLNKLKSRSSLTDGDIEDTVREFVDGQKEATQELTRYIGSARSLGVSRRQIESTLNYYKIPKEYLRDVTRGRFRRPEIPKSLVDDLRARGDVTSVERLVKARDQIRSGWPIVESYE